MPPWVYLVLASTAGLVILAALVGRRLVRRGSEGNHYRDKGDSGDGTSD